MLTVQKWLKNEENQMLKQVRRFAKSAAMLVVIAFSLAGCTAVGKYTDDVKHRTALKYFQSDESKQQRYRDRCNSIGITAESDSWERCLIEAHTLDNQPMTVD